MRNLIFLQIAWNMHLTIKTHGYRLQAKVTYFFIFLCWHCIIRLYWYNLWAFYCSRLSFPSRGSWRSTIAGLCLSVPAFTIRMHLIALFSGPTFVATCLMIFTPRIIQQVCIDIVLRDMVDSGQCFVPETASALMTDEGSNHIQKHSICFSLQSVEQLTRINICVWISWKLFRAIGSFLKSVFTLIAFQIKMEDRNWESCLSCHESSQQARGIRLRCEWILGCQSSLHYCCQALR